MRFGLHYGNEYHNPSTTNTFHPSDSRTSHITQHSTGNLTASRSILFRHTITTATVTVHTVLPSLLHSCYSFLSLPGCLLSHTLPFLTMADKIILETAPYDPRFSSTVDQSKVR